ncbi:hypothetical protein [Sphingomonas sp. MMS24-J13]|uniref:hypothetical protein n=1 Tax=Sphingomonas sp. MMS24-J13 TaxID=3238686 RepID=UPI00384F0E6B
MVEIADAGFRESAEGNIRAGGMEVDAAIAAQVAFDKPDAGIGFRLLMPRRMMAYRSYRSADGLGGDPRAVGAIRVTDVAGDEGVHVAAQHHRSPVVAGYDRMTTFAAAEKPRARMAVLGSRSIGTTKRQIAAR